MSNYWMHIYMHVIDTSSRAKNIFFFLRTTKIKGVDMYL